MTDSPTQTLRTMRHLGGRTLSLRQADLSRKGKVSLRSQLLFQQVESLQEFISIRSRMGTVFYSLQQIMKYSPKLTMQAGVDLRQVESLQLEEVLQSTSPKMTLLTSQLQRTFLSLKMVLGRLLRSNMMGQPS